MKILKKEEFLKNYGHIKVKFNSYFKYCFSFIGNVDYTEIYITVGGHADSIYEFEVKSSDEFTIKYLVEWLGIEYATVSINGDKIEEFYN